MKSYLLALLTTLVLSTGSASAATWDTTTPSGSAFRMYIPDDLPVVYGFLVTCNPSGGDNRPYAGDARYQDLARTLGFGVIGTQIPNNTANTGYAADIITAMNSLASVSGHAEVANAPVVIEGLSLGGFIAMQFAVEFPSRTIAYLDAASRLVITTGFATGFDQVPGLFTLGDLDLSLQDALDRRTEIASLRASGYPVAMWIQFGAGHEYKNALKLGYHFFAEAVAHRYPAGASPLTGPVALVDLPQDTGWLADYTTFQSQLTQIATYGAYAKPKTQGFWLPTADVAFAFQGHSTETKRLAFSEENDSYLGFVAAPLGVAHPLAVTVTGFAGVTKVSFYDGATPISADLTAPYTASWTPSTIGVHNLVAIAENAAGDHVTGLPLAMLVPGLGNPSGAGGGGTPDAGPPPIDAGVVPIDASVIPIDASVVPVDASVIPIDASTAGGTPDAGTAGATPDAGTAGGTPDASTSGGTPDAGTSGGTPDAGSGKHGGDGCQVSRGDSTAGGATLLVIAAIAGGRRRRR